jgi:beta-N-acetylhexosaminidase
MQAIKEGRITRKRIEQSALKILAAKARVGLQRSRLVDLDELTDQLDSPEAAEQAQEAANRAITLVKNEGGIVPLSTPETGCLFVLAESRYGQQGRAMLAETKRLAPKLPALIFDPTVSDLDVKDSLARFPGCERPVVAAFVSVAAYRGNVALPGNFGALVEGLVATKRPVTLIALGSPYLLRAFPNVSAYLASYSVVPPSEIAAVRALLGQIPIRGKLPVSIPGFAKNGDGLELPARVSQSAMPQ